MPDLAKQRLRGKFEAAVLDASQETTHRQFGAHKAAALGAMSGTVVELGPGTGVNLRYYAPGVQVIGIEPNPMMHGRLRSKAAEADISLEIRMMRGESLDVDDAAVDGVVGTLVLCGVDDPRLVLAEVQRVLRPGGTYFFLEHVAAPDGTRTRSVQRVVKRPHRWLFNGCEIDRSTEDLITSAGFSQIQVERIDIGARGGHVRHFIAGTAVR
jgi:ubiquinone/menaquinone biosynthesis C-methylase UbiE